MKYFKSEGEFWEYYKRFNALYGSDWNGWKLTQARGRLEDLFGACIIPGDMFFRKQTSHEYGTTLCLSMASMEKVLLVVMAQNLRLNELGEKLLRNQRDALTKRLPGPEMLGASQTEAKPGA